MHPIAFSYSTLSVICAGRASRTTTQYGSLGFRGAVWHDRPGARFRGCEEHRDLATPARGGGCVR
jgi:hypothetical protein